MAELIAASTAIGVVSSLITFADVGWRILKRLNEYNERRTEVPAVVRNIIAQLPLIIEKVEALKRSTKDGSLIPPKSPLAVAVVSCDQEISRLDSLTAKLIPDSKDSKLVLAKKAIRSVKYDKEIETTWDSLQRYVFTFTFYFTQTSTGPKESDVSTRKPTFNVPFERDKNFVGRASILSDIKNRLSIATRISLAGIGGIGKSQIAIEYCYRFAAENPDCHVFWVHASSTERFRESYSNIARRNAIPGWDDAKANTIQLVCEWLSDCDRKWLMVLDNADDLEIFCGSKSKEDDQAVLLTDYIPKSPNGSILITTRDKRAGMAIANGEPPIDVLIMNHNDTQALLRSKIPDKLWCESPSTKLLEDLEYLPLAITQAAAFICQNAISSAAYLELFHTEDADVQKLLSQELSDPRRDSRAQNSIVRTSKLSFDRIASTDPYASEILSLMAVLDRHSIPLMLLRKDEIGIVEFTTAIGLLQAFSLVSVEKDGSGFEMHRLVQVSLQNWLEVQGTLSEWQLNALTAVNRQLPMGAFQEWKTCEMLMPHAQAVVAYKYKTDFPLQQVASILSRMAYYFQNLGQYKLASNTDEEALGIFRRVCGEEHAYTLATMNHLASAYSYQGKYAQAAEIQLPLVEICKRALGEEHPDTLRSMNNLALTYSYQGKFAQAAEILLPLIEIRKRVLGEEHPDILGSMSSLAFTYSNQGKYTLAAEIQAQVLEISERILGKEHPAALLYKDNLACTYAKQGEYAKAKDLFETVYEGRVKSLGRDHPDTISTAQSLDQLGEVE